MRKYMPRYMSAPPAILAGETEFGLSAPQKTSPRTTVRGDVYFMLLYLKKHVGYTVPTICSMHGACVIYF